METKNKDKLKENARRYIEPKKEQREQKENKGWEYMQVVEPI
jgi:hypothetical protein